MIWNAQYSATDTFLKQKGVRKKLFETEMTKQTI